MERQPITEEMKVHDKWYEEARHMDLEKLPKFISGLLDNYEHDYGTICHALAAGAIATCWAMNTKAGITGFQAGAIMWEFIRNWMSYKNQPMSLLTYEDMLYPQYEYRYQKTMTRSIFKWLQERAKEKLENASSMHERVKTHMESIVEGNIPFGYIIKEEWDTEWNDQ